MNAEVTKGPLNSLALQIHMWAHSKGWWGSDLLECHCHDTARDLNLLAAKLLMAHSEITEAVEELRIAVSLTALGQPYFVDGKPEGVGVELTDLMIRTLDLLWYIGGDSDALMNLKMRYNDSRPHRHGGKAL